MLAALAIMTDKCPVLVTGGAGYIGSHAVLALVTSTGHLSVMMAEAASMVRQ